MSQSLADSLPGKGGSGLKVWLKSSAYTRRLLLGEGGDPWQGAAQFLAYFSQAQGLLRPDVAVVEVGELERLPRLIAHRVGRERSGRPPSGHNMRGLELGHRLMELTDLVFGEGASHGV